MFSNLIHYTFNIHLLAFYQIDLPLCSSALKALLLRKKEIILLKISCQIKGKKLIPSLHNNQVWILTIHIEGYGGVDNPKSIWILLPCEFLYLILNINMLGLGAYYRIKLYIFILCKPDWEAFKYWFVYILVLSLYLFYMNCYFFKYYSVPSEVELLLFRSSLELGLKLFQRVFSKEL